MHCFLSKAFCVSFFTITVMANSSSVMSADFQGPWYGGAGFGKTKLEPDANGSVYSVDDSNSGGYKIFFGRDINDRLSIEGHYSDLGKAGISPGGELEYRVFGASALYHFYSQPTYLNYQRQGYSIFGLAGLGKMDNKASEDVNFERDNNYHVHLGAGVEYGFPQGWFTRAEFTFFDEDAKMLAISIGKRFGVGSIREFTPFSSASAPPVVTQVDADTGVDSDKDGVSDSMDVCSDTPPGAEVDLHGCPLIETAPMVFDSVHFDVNSSVLSAAAKRQLDTLAEALRLQPELRVEVQGHADDRDSSDYNLWLTNRRVQHVIDYLVNQGITRERLVPRAYSDKKPVADNTTAEGRAQNRRVEFLLLP